jgi:hypothetical protein
MLQDDSCAEITKAMQKIALAAGVEMRQDKKVTEFADRICNKINEARSLEVKLRGYLKMAKRDVLFVLNHGSKGWDNAALSYLDEENH